MAVATVVADAPAVVPDATVVGEVVPAEVDEVSLAFEELLPQPAHPHQRRPPP